MAIANLFSQGSGGDKINGLIEDYYVYAGENINAGGFVEFINGVASQTDCGNSVDTELNSATKAGYVISAVLLPNGNVFIAHSSSTSYDLYGIVCTINGVTITYGTNTRIGTSNRGNKISSIALSNGNVFISYGYDDSNYYLYGIVCVISGTTITAGSHTKLSSVVMSGYTISTVLLPNGNVFIAHSYDASYYLYGMICTISGTTITVVTDAQLTNTSYAGYGIAVSVLNNGNLFIAHSYSSAANSYLYGIVCSISGTNITCGTDTQLSSVRKSGKILSQAVLANGNVFIAHSNTDSYYLYAMVCTISGTTITHGNDVVLSSSYSGDGNTISTVILPSGQVLVTHCYGSSNILYGIVCSVYNLSVTTYSDTQLNNIINAGFAISALILSNDTIFIAHSSGSSYYLNAQMFGISNNIPTNHIVATDYETQVRNSTTALADGIAKTSGTGGTATAHNQKIQIYVP